MPACLRPNVTTEPNGERADIVNHLAHQRQNSQPAGVASMFTRVKFLGVDVTPVILEKWRAEERREYVCCASVYGLVEAQRDPQIRGALNRSGLTTKDGMPLVWWCQRPAIRTRAATPGRIWVGHRRPGTSRRRHLNARRFLPAVASSGNPC